MKYTLTFYLFIALAFFECLNAQPVFLKNLSNNSGNFAGVNGILYYSALDSLYRSDGTTNANSLVKKTGENIQSISSLSVNGYFFFVTLEGSGKKALWKSNGTAANTIKLGSFNIVNPLIVYQNQLILAADDGISGLELWKVNSSLSSVSLIKDIAGGSASGLLSEPIISNNLLYFKANSGAGGVNIWKSNGTPGGTTLAIDLAFDNYYELTDVDGTIFFYREEYNEFIHLYKTNGTQAGTTLIKKYINTWEDSYFSLYDLIPFKNELFFTFTSGIPIDYLGRSNGTEGGTKILGNDISIDGFTSKKLIVKDRLVFHTNTQSFPNGIFKSDGTNGGTEYLAWLNIDPPQIVSTGNLLFYINDAHGYYGSPDTPEDFQQIWQSDLNPSNTKTLSDKFGGNYSGAGNIVVVGEKIYFTTKNTYPGASPELAKYKLWYYDPTKPTANIPYFTLVDANTDKDLAWLREGDDVVKYPSDEINIRYNPVGSAGSVLFKLEDINYRIEGSAPFALAGDNNGNYNPWSPATPGARKLTGIQYSGANATGTPGTPLITHFNLVERTVNKDPIVNAGPDKTVYLPSDSLSLTASATDTDGSITHKAWYYVSGPSYPYVQNLGNLAKISGLIEGEYVFQFEAQDDQGAYGNDDVIVKVVRPANVPKLITFSLINADADVVLLPEITYYQTINVADYPSINFNIKANPDQVPVSRVVFDLDGVVTTENSAPFAVFGDNNGNYNGKKISYGMHTITATPYNGNVKGIALSIPFNIDDPSVVNLPPSVNAGPDRTITLPQNSITITGTATDPNQENLSVYWYQISGPPLPITNVFSRTLSLSNLSPGVYGFNFVARDFKYSSAYDQLYITVLSPGGTQTRESDLAATSPDTYGNLTCIASPNPSSEAFKLTFNNVKQGNITVEILSPEGILLEKVFEGTVSDTDKLELEWKGDGQQSGLYLCRFASETESRVLKLLLTR